MSRFRDRFRRGGAPPAAVGWNNDLDRLPRLRVDPALSFGITQAHVDAAVTVEDGALVVDHDALVTAGAVPGNGVYAIVWLDSLPAAQAPLYFYADGDYANDGTYTNETVIGVAYFAPDADAPSNPPSTPGNTTQGYILALGGGQSSFSSNPAGRRVIYTWGNATIQSLLVGALVHWSGWLTCTPLDAPGGGVTRISNTTYPPVQFPVTITNTRAAGADGLPLPDGHRLRWCLRINLGTSSGSGGRGKTRFRALDARWSP